MISGDCNGFVRKYDIPKSIGKSSFSLSTLPFGEYNVVNPTINHPQFGFIVDVPS